MSCIWKLHVRVRECDSTVPDRYSIFAISEEKCTCFDKQYSNMSWVIQNFQHVWKSRLPTTFSKESRWGGTMGWCWQVLLKTGKNEKDFTLTHLFQLMSRSVVLILKYPEKCLVSDKDNYLSIILTYHSWSLQNTRHQLRLSVMVVANNLDELTEQDILP